MNTSLMALCLCTEGNDGVEGCENALASHITLVEVNIRNYEQGNFNQSKCYRNRQKMVCKVDVLKVKSFLVLQFDLTLLYAV